MTQQELFEAFYSLICHSKGSELAKFYRIELNKCKTEADYKFLRKSLDMYIQHRKEMTKEAQDIFKTLARDVMRRQYEIFHDNTRKEL